MQPLLARCISRSGKLTEHDTTRRNTHTHTSILSLKCPVECAAAHTAVFHTHLVDNYADFINVFALLRLFQDCLVLIVKI